MRILPNNCWNAVVCVRGCVCARSRNTVVCTPVSVHLLLCLSAAPRFPTTSQSLKHFWLPRKRDSSADRTVCFLHSELSNRSIGGGKGWRGGGAECEKNVPIPPCVGVLCTPTPSVSVCLLQRWHFTALPSPSRRSRKARALTPASPAATSRASATRLESSAFMPGTVATGPPHKKPCICSHLGLLWRPDALLWPLTHHYTSFSIQTSPLVQLSAITKTNVNLF